MKKTFRFLSMAALLVVGAIMTGCSSEDNIDNPQQPANKDNVVTLTATVGFEANAGTRAITPNGTDPWTKTFESTNKIAVIYKDGEGKTQKAESGALTLSNDDKTATFTVTLTNPATDGAVRYIYPATMAKTPATGAEITNDAATIDYSGIFSSQNGDLTTLGTNYDLAVFDGSLSGTDLPASATLTNPLAICKFTLKDGTGTNPVSVNSLTISDGTNAYTVKPTSALSEVYVAMKPVTDANINFTANAGSTNYTKTATEKTLAASNLYPITVKMTEFSLATPLTLEAITAGTITVDSPKSGMQYSLNGGATKTAVSGGIDVAAGDKVAFYGDGTNITDYDGTCITGGTAEVKVYGNIMSLVNETGFATATELTEESCFYELFSNYKNLKDASGLLLPATTLVEACYQNMFFGCTSLTAAPKELPATTLEVYCYCSMFDGCASLTTAPELKATSLASDCYCYMFYGCTSLTTAPELKATSLANSCYYCMFEGCTSLTTAYVKAAYTDSYDECADMFDGCTAAGAVLHTTTASKDSWDGKMGSGKTWSTWTAVDDWN